MGQAEFSGHKIEHSGEVNGGTKPASLSFDCAKYAVESFHEGVGQAPFPVGQDALEVILYLVSHLDHRPENVRLVKPGHPADPAAPDPEALMGYRGVGTAIDVLQDQTHLISLAGAEIF